jgi:hypothetical protein
MDSGLRIFSKIFLTAQAHRKQDPLRIFLFLKKVKNWLWLIHSPIFKKNHFVLLGYKESLALVSKILVFLFSFL